MQVQQENINKRQEQNNQFLVVSTEEIRNIAEGLTQPVHPNEEGFIESLNQKIHDREHELQKLKQQNVKLKSSNKQLMKQLQTFSKKLDQQLKRRTQSQQRRSKPTLKPQEKQSIEIQNLYKKIEIYKKQVAMLKGKLNQQTHVSNKINDYENKLKFYMKENDELRDEIKSLKKIIKLQEKGLSDIGAEGFLKMVADNQKLKEQLRRSRLEMDQIERKYRTCNLQGSKPKHKTPKDINSDSPQPYFSHSSIKNDFKRQKKIIMNRKKNFSDYRIRTQPQTTLQKQFKTQDDNSQINIMKPYMEKIEKLQGKIRAMNGEKVRQREIIDNLKVQILQKDKEVNYLREKTENLRKINKAKKVKKTIQSKENIASSPDHSYMQAIQQMPSRSQSQLQTHPQDQIIPMQDHINKPTKSQQRHQATGKSKQRYPRLQQIGSKNQSSYKWNHHQFSSKIKEIQVYLNTNGSLAYVHARYEKGEPIKSSQVNGKKSSALVCQATSEYVQHIRGGFRNNHLQYLIVKTNQKRVSEFGDTEMEKQCENFQFCIMEHEYPCALLGENDHDGLLRFGCFVQRLQQ